ncbi:MAG: gliding motility protein GldM [Paludibacteraceae bacterium]
MGGAKNCPETPRQKMIGMMYLVLTAMLALNVSAEILNGFKMVDDSLHDSIEAANTRNDKMYRDFEEATRQNPEKMQDWYNRASELRQRADSLYNYIQDFKTQIVLIADGDKAKQKIAANIDPTREIESQDNTDAVGQYALNEGNGAVLREMMAMYRDYIVELAAKKPELASEFNNIFSCNKIWSKNEKDSVAWEVGMFEGMPVCACITVLTKIQNDVRATESELVLYLMDQTDAGDLRVNKLNAYVIPKSDYVIQGAKYTAQIILAGVDSTRRPEYYINGQRINDQGIYEVVASGLGQKSYSGQIAYMDPATGEMQYLPFQSEYTVSEPSVTISNTALDIMYRGYDNPFSISVPGVSNNRLKVEVSGGASVTQKNGLWIINPNEQAKNITVKVMAEMEGTMHNMGERTYRVKALPDPAAYFKSGEKEFNDGSIPRSTLLNPNATIIASYGADGLLDLAFTVTSFKLNANGTYLDGKGNKFSKEHLDRLGKLKKGAIVVITDIRAVGPNGQEKRLSSIPLTLN